MFGPASQELFVIFLIGLVLVDGSKLPELARSLGRPSRRPDRVFPWNRR